MAKQALKPGGRFKSAVCETQVMVVKAPGGEFELGCGGPTCSRPMAKPRPVSSSAPITRPAA